MDQNYLDAELIRRSDHGLLNAAFKARVVGYDDRVTTKRRTLIVRVGKDSVLDIDLQHYYILSLTEFVCQVLITDRFGTSFESQEKAHKIIDVALEDLGNNVVRKEEESSSMVDPKRIVITFESAKTPITRREGVLVSFLEPSEDFDYHTARIREWHGQPPNRKLGPAILCLHSHMFCITKIAYFKSHGGSTTTNYGRYQPMAAWGKLGLHIKEFNDKDLTKLRSWKPEDKKDYDDGYCDYWSGGGGGYPYTHSYQAPVASFRVSGDEVGAKLYLNQLEQMVKLDKRTFSSLEEVLIEPEKKSKAEEKPKPDKKASSAGAADNPQTGRTYCPICDIFDCGPHCAGLGLVPGAYNEGWGDFGEYVH